MDLIINADSFIFEKEGKLRDVYRIGNKIGNGAFASVRRIKHRETSENRVVKTIHKKLIKTESEKQSVFNEVSILRTLDHPNIVRLHEFYQDEKNYYIITEFCSGGELFEKIIQSRSFSESQAAVYMQQIFTTLIYLHDRRVVHRDLKPENLMLSSNSTDARIKLIDFGSSCISQPNSFLSELVGTAYYTAPEVLRQNYNEKCDIWSAGVILYILLCGFPPFSGNCDREIHQKILTGKVPFPSPEWDSISFEAKDLIQRLLNPNITRRISVREALTHTWMTNASRVSLNIDFASVILKNLQNFRGCNQLKKGVISFICSQLLSFDEREELSQIFKSLDVDQNGTLSKSELKRGFLKVFGNKIEDVDLEVDRIMTEVDFNKSGCIEYNEFITAAINRQQLYSKRRLEIAFESFDLDHSGYIDANELRSVLGKYNKYEDWFWVELIKEVDLNGDGVIDLSEFTKMMLSSF